jgi:hypothetical protein
MKIRSFISFAEIVLGFSSFMDALLWFTKNFLVPSYVVTLFSIGTIMLLEVLKKLLQKSEN